MFPQEVVVHPVTGSPWSQSTTPMEGCGGLLVPGLWVPGSLRLSEAASHTVISEVPPLSLPGSTMMGGGEVGREVGSRVCGFAFLLVMVATSLRLPHCCVVSLPRFNCSWCWLLRQECCYCLSHPPGFQVWAATQHLHCYYISWGWVGEGRWVHLSTALPSFL